VRHGTQARIERQTRAAERAARTPLCPECRHSIHRHTRSQGCVLCPLPGCTAAPPFIGSLAPVYAEARHA